MRMWQRIRLITQGKWGLLNIGGTPNALIYFKERRGGLPLYPSLYVLESDLVFAMNSRTDDVSLHN